MARFIPDDILEQIRLRADIVEVVQSYIPTLKRAGSAWKACCPFHQEKTPSFIVNPARQIYKCFGCGKGGGVFSFVMEMEKLDFPNAVEFLARKYGIAIPEPEVTAYHGERGVAFKDDTVPEQEADYNLRERLYSLHEKLAQWYVHNLNGNVVPAVSAYFATRGIPDDFATRFQIGASPDTWDSAIQFAHKNGFTDQELRLSGIVSSKEENSTHIYDRFRNRLMFPIWNEQGRVVGFSARTVEKDVKGQKYVNSPETPVFKKNRILYALHLARASIAEKKYAVLCEGQIDVIALHRVGCDNAVAAQGTAFGIEHARILKRYTGDVCLALDNDGAGRKAVFADAAILLPLGFTLRVVTWLDAKDADEVLKGQGPEAVRNAVETAEDFFSFAFRQATQKNDISLPAGKAAVAAEMLTLIKQLENAATCEAYLSWLADKLGLAVESLREDLKKKFQDDKRIEQYRKRREAERENAALQDESVEKKKPARVPFSERTAGVKDAFSCLLKLVVASKDFAIRAAHDVEEEMCEGSVTGMALDIILQLTLNDEWEDAASKMLMEMAKNGCDPSSLVALLPEKTDEGMPQNDDSDAENNLPEEKKNPVSTEYVNKINLNFSIEEDLKPEELDKVRDMQIYDDCMRVIRLEFCRYHLDLLMEESANTPDGSPEKMEILKNVFEWTRRLRDLARKQK